MSKELIQHPSSPAAAGSLRASPLPSTSETLGAGFATLRIVKRVFVVSGEPEPAPRFVVEERFWWWPFWDFVESFGDFNSAYAFLQRKKARRKKTPLEILHEE